MRRFWEHYWILQKTVSDIKRWYYGYLFWYLKRGYTHVFYKMQMNFYFWKKNLTCMDFLKWGNFSTISIICGGRKIHYLVRCGPFFRYLTYFTQYGQFSDTGCVQKSLFFLEALKVSANKTKTRPFLKKISHSALDIYLNFRFQK